MGIIRMDPAYLINNSSVFPKLHRAVIKSWVSLFPKSILAWDQSTPEWRWEESQCDVNLNFVIHQIPNFSGTFYRALHGAVFMCIVTLMTYCAHCGITIALGKFHAFKEKYRRWIEILLTWSYFVVQRGNFDCELLENTCDWNERRPLGRNSLLQKPFSFSDFGEFLVFCFFSPPPSHPSPSGYFDFPNFSQAMRLPWDYITKDFLPDLQSAKACMQIFRQSSFCRIAEKLVFLFSRPPLLNKAVENLKGQGNSNFWSKY